MRVMVVNPVFGRAIPVAEHCVGALADLGCESSLIDLTCFQDLVRDNRGSVGPQSAKAIALYEAVAERVQHKVRRFEPDLVLVLLLAPLHKGLLDWLRDQGIKTAYWFVDNLGRYPFWRVQAPWYDHYFTIQDEPSLTALRNMGARHCAYLPNACRVGAHTDIVLTAEERERFGTDVAFVGTLHPNRMAVFDELADFDLGLWGKGWSRCEGPLAERVKEDGRIVTAEEELKIYASSKIVLNLHTDGGAGNDDAHDFLNARTFMTAGCGTLQLVDDRALLSRHFLPNEELVLFSNMEHLRTRLHHYLEQTDEREQIVARAKQRVLAEHTYRHRMQQILDTVNTESVGE